MVIGQRREREMNWKTYRATVLVGSLGLALLTSCGPRRVQLALNLEEGDVYRMRLLSQSMTVTVSEVGEGTSYDTSGFDITFTVTEVGDQGNAWIDAVYDWASMSTRAGTGEIEPPDEADPSAEGIEELEGRGFSVQIAPNGEVLQIAGHNDLLDEVLEDLGLDDEEILLGFGQMIESLIGDDGLKAQMSDVILRCPEGPVVVGDSWTATTELRGVLALVTERTYTLRTLEEGVATIDVIATVHTDPEAYPVDMTLYEITYDLAGSGEGVIEIDVETGWTTSGTVTSTLSGETVIVMGETELTVQTSVESVSTLDVQS
jgi:hypothetical protein